MTDQNAAPDLSGEAPAQGHNMEAIAHDLEGIVERIERINEEITVLQEDRKEVFEEAKGKGFDVKALRKTISIRAKDRHQLEELGATVAMYMQLLEGGDGDASGRAEAFASLL